MLAGVVFDRLGETRRRSSVDSMTRDRLGALAAILIAVVGLVVVLVSWGDGRRSHVGEYYALLAAAAAGMVFFVSAGNLMTMFLGARVVLDLALRPVRARHAPRASRSRPASST